MLVRTYARGYGAGYGGGGVAGAISWRASLVVSSSRDTGLNLLNLSRPFPESPL